MESGGMTTVETGVVIAGLSFTVCAWHSLPADGWFWTAIAEDHAFTRSGQRAWCNARCATEAALIALERELG